MLTSVLPALLASVLLAAFAFWMYLRRELPVAGRRFLAALRAAILVLLVLLLWNPSLPSAVGGGAERTWLALDASASMNGGGDSGRTPWQRASELAGQARARGERVVLLGDPPVPVDSLQGLGASGHASVLAPLLRRAAEAGAREVRLVSDLRLADAVATQAELDRLGLGLEVEDVGTPLRSAGVADVEAPATERAGAPVTLAVSAFGTEGAAGDSATLTLDRDGTRLASWRVLLPGPGTVVRRTLDVDLPDGAGAVLWRAHVALNGDEFPDDDARTVVTEVDPSVGVVALLALAPDWESRFLLPVLNQVSGLPTRGWLRVGPDRFLPTGGGEVVSGDELRPQLGDARILVVQGPAAGAPPWLADVVSRARRVLILAGDPAATELAGVSARPAPAGEWYAAAPPPPSPLASLLSSLPVAQLPPLSDPLAPTGDGPGVPALELQRPGGGATTPALWLVDRSTRRLALGLARGFWRWAFRPGEPAEAYRRLWSGATGWLLELGEGRALAGVAPDAVVVAAGAPVTWRAPEAPGGAVEIALTRADTLVRTDTLAVESDGRALEPALPPGTWAWRARVVRPDSLAAGDRSWEGRLVSEPWTDELRPPRAALASVVAPTGSGDVGGGRPLRTSPWPFLLLLGLLSLEWIGRRRSGLR